VERLLSDEYLSGLVKSFIEDPAGEAAAALRADSPDLAEWIETNKAGLEKLTAGIDQSQADFAALQEANKKAVQPGDTVPFADATLKQLIPDYGNLRGEAYDATNLPAIITFAKNPGVPAAIRGEIVGELNNLATKYPQYAKEMADLDASDIYRLGLDKPGAMKNYVEFLDNSAYLDMADTSSPSALMSSLAIGGDAEQQLLELRRMQSLGLGDSADGTLLGILDPDGDGRIAADQLDRMKTDLKGIFSGGSVKNLLSRDKAGNLPTVAKLAAGLRAKATGDSALFGAMQDIIRDGDAGYDETKNAVRGLNQGQMESLYNRLQNNPLVKGDGAKGIADFATGEAYEANRKNLPQELKGNDGQEFGHWANRVRDGMILYPNVKAAFENALSKLNTAASTGSAFERAGAEKLRRELAATLDKSNELVRKQEQEAADRAKAEAEKERAAVRKELERNISQLSSRVPRDKKEAQDIERAIAEINTQLSGRWK
jgi:hypothetical protein